MDGGPPVDHWKDRKAKYYINTVSQSAPAGAASAIKAADNTWNNSAWQEQGGSDFSFQCEGDTQRYADKKDNKNVIAFQPYRVSTTNPPVARTFIRQTEWFRPDRLKEVDTILNTKYYWATGAQANHYDIQSVMTHEFGHWLVLEHLYDGDSEAGGCDEFLPTVMYHKFEKNATKRDLHWIDKWGKWYIYTSGEVSMAPSAVLIEDVPPPLQDATNKLQTRLLQNYPDPFNPETWIPYELADDANVNIEIYDSVGKSVRVFELGKQESGRYYNKTKALYWDGKNQLGEHVTSGVYFYTLRADGVTDTRRLVVIK